MGTQLCLPKLEAGAAVTANKVDAHWVSEPNSYAGDTMGDAREAGNLSPGFYLGLGGGGPLYRVPSFSFQHKYLFSREMPCQFKTGTGKPAGGSRI